MLTSASNARRIGTLPGSFRHCTIAFVILGLALRAYHYGRNPSVWHDEAALILNVLGKSFHGLLGPLYFAEAGPPLFLWSERAMRLLFGDGVYSLRFLPFAASCAALVMVATIARRLLLPAAVPVAVLLFACSRSLLWHSSEAKPYAIDVAIAVLLPLLACGVLRHWSLEKRLLFFGFLAPVVILLSYPACFVMGGVVLSLLPEVWQSQRRQAWLTLLFLIASTSATFLVLLFGPIREQRCAGMESCWVHAFAPWDKPWRVPLWAMMSAFGMPRYCLDPLGDWLLAPAIIGCIALWKRGQEACVILLTTPVALAFVASCLKAYPFDASRVISFATPALGLLTAEGSIVVARWLSRPSTGTRGELPRRTRRFALATMFVLLVLPLGRAVKDILRPWPRADVEAAVEFVMHERRDSEPVVGNHWEHAYYFRDLQQDFFFWDGRPVPEAPRFWLVLTAGTEAECDFLTAAAIGNRWHPVREKRFEQCRAVLMVRNESLAYQANE